jgi:primosomal protein N' (replication factor Y)
MIAEVVFNLPLERSFHYLVPDALAQELQRGMRVLAPFGRRELVGYVVGLPERSPIRVLKVIRRVIDPWPVIAEERWELASWLSAYYACSVGEALAVMVPSDLRFIRKGQPSSAPLDAASPPGVPRHRTLSPNQRKAFETIAAAVDASHLPAAPGAAQAGTRTILLHGVTGSGKTELYLQAIDQVLQHGRSAICLVPEIALTPQTIDRFRERFGEGVAVWHSRLTARQRAAEWLRITNGTCRIVVGARSAVFAPVAHLGLIVLDEEHEPAYKQEDTPRYHAREVAQARARLVGATVLLGSATPSIESYYAASRKRGALVTLPKRIEGRPLPKVDIIDMREQWATRRSAAPLSSRLERAIEAAIERKEQVMLLLNRRGFARAAQCQTCGAVVRCRRCAVPLIYHASRQQLVCHYCNFQEPLAAICPACRKGYLRLRGTGTERVESELHRLFPAASIARMDRDTTKDRDSHRAFYEAVKSGRVIALVGTQMIAKGLDIPAVTLVGVVSADTALNLPDFRAGERTFDLLTQVAGRAGRGDRAGEVLIQTFCPRHYAIRAARQHNYGAFYEQELQMRRRLRLPPFAHLIELTIRASSRRRADETAAELAVQLRRRCAARQVTLLGPAPHRIPRLRRTYRVCLVLKGASVEPMVAILRRTLQPGRRFRGMPVAIDVDPL